MSWVNTMNIEQTWRYWQGDSRRPGWLSDDLAWREQLGALTEADTVWITAQWELAGGVEPSLDTSWITTETIGGWRLPDVDSVFWPIASLLAVMVIIFGSLVLFVGGGQ